jgi:hypothetical protein
MKLLGTASPNGLKSAFGATSGSGVQQVQRRSGPTPAVIGSRHEVLAGRRISGYPDYRPGGDLRRDDPAAGIHDSREGRVGHALREARQ